MDKSIIEARGLTKQYGEIKVVDSINFEIKKGECYGILGPNGAGKTSTMKMMYGSSPLSAGDLFLLGINISENTRRIKTQIGVVPQDSGLDPDFGVLDNLVVYARYYGLVGKAAMKKSRELLRLMRLEEYENYGVEQISGGMQRRLAIARSLLGEPKILFLDEPTTGLDPHARLWIWEALEDLKREGITLILTTHYMEEAERLCDRVAIMDKGRILAEDTPRKMIDEHIGREVVEFRVSSRDVSYYLDKVRDKYKYQILNNKVRLFIQPGQEGRDVLKLISSESISIRNSSLEDVFLKLAGHELS